MSLVLKCFVGILAVLCFVQFIEMTRFGRDEQANNAFAQKLAELGPNLNKIFQEEVNRFKDAFNSEEFKELMASGTQHFNELFEVFKKK